MHTNPILCSNLIPSTLNLPIEVANVHSAPKTLHDSIKLFSIQSANQTEVNTLDEEKDL